MLPEASCEQTLHFTANVLGGNDLRYLCISLPMCFETVTCETLHFTANVLEGNDLRYLCISLPMCFETVTNDATLHFPCIEHFEIMC